MYYYIFLCNRLYIILGLSLAFLLSSCNVERGNNRKHEEIYTPIESQSDRYERINTRLGTHQYNGYIVGYNGDSIHSPGEAILWTFTYIGAAECEDAYRQYSNYRENIENQDGQPHRILPIVRKDLWDYTDRGFNFDGWAGFIYGYSSLWNKCPEYREELKANWNQFHDRFIRQGKKLWPNGSHADIPPGFDIARRSFDRLVNNRSLPSQAYIRSLEGIIMVWMQGIQEKREACYRANLAFLHMLSLENIGYEFSSYFNSKYCSIMKPFDIPTIDYWCGHNDLNEWLDNYKLNEWDYRHQRCGSWEQPDGNIRPGRELLESSAIDYIFAYGLKYGNRTD